MICLAVCKIGGGGVKKLPIGINDFQEMVKGNYYYVDKTMFIKDVIDLSGKVKLITRPRRFGKTLNMNMLRRFFSMREKEDLFENFAIWNEKGLMREYYHRYPVVFISLRQVKEVNWKSAIGKMKAVLSEVVKEIIGYAKEDVDRNKLERLASLEAEEWMYSDVLMLATKIVYQSTGKKAIVLIDEYDVPIEAAYTYRHKDEGYYDNMTAFMRGMLTAALKDNPYLEFGILTGVYRVAKESIFSGLNNLAVYTVFESEMSERFGFTEEEVHKMLDHYKLGEEDKRMVERWYGGYRIGKSDNLYNPWSVLNYIRARVEGGEDPERAAQPYWINTSSNDLIKEQIESNEELKEEMVTLLEGEEVEKYVETDLSLWELEEDPSGVWSLLTSGGYVSARYVGEGNLYALKIPNSEIMRFFRRSVMRWIEKETKTKASKMLDSVRALMKRGEYERFKEELEGYIINAMSYLDLGGREPERVYKAFLLGLLSIAVNGYVVESEVESGYGRLDVVIYPREKRYGEYAAVFEVKRAEREKELEEIAKEALRQIRKRKYYEKMRRQGYKVIGFGIAFCGKKVAIDAENMMGV